MFTTYVQNVLTSEGNYVIYKYVLYECKMFTVNKEMDMCLF